MIGRIPLLDVSPTVLGGARPAKAVPGELFPVSATVFREGHDAVAANVVLTGPQGSAEGWHPMREVSPGSDRYEAWVSAPAPGDWSFHVEAWADPVATWYHIARAKIPAGQDIEAVFAEGADLLERAALVEPVLAGEHEVQFPGQELLEDTAAALRDERATPEARLALADGPAVHEALAVRPLREFVTRSAPLPLRVDRERALFGSWYEFFPRSEGAEVDPTGERPPRAGTLRTAAERLPAVAAMGFDVVYLPPIHPIGTTFRKGRGNALVAGEHDPGSPWGIGSPAGGHDAVNPDLGTLKDFDHFVDRAGKLGLEVAIDFALQCSPDHPWVSKHPEWFRHRADGTIAYAENPPKKYQDIYPIYFDTDLPGLLEECERVLRFWMGHGVRIFRVDNPHTKPLNFWEPLLERIHATDPDVLFLSEAFTRPAMMRTLAAIGFHQSYTYFTWRNGKDELEEYLRELSAETSAYLRPNLFVNTPDILHAYLQFGGRPAFEIRAILAATLGPTWGVYSGFELCENIAAAPGSEEYADSEKYQLRPRDWASAEAEGRSLAPLLTRLNTLRRAHGALRGLRNLHFHHTDSDAVLCYSKRHHDGDTVITVVTLDPHQTREATVYLDLPALGLGWSDRFVVHDELGGGTFHWGRDNYIRLDPHENPAHLLTLQR